MRAWVLAAAGLVLVAGCLGGQRGPAGGDDREGDPGGEGDGGRPPAGPPLAGGTPPASVWYHRADGSVATAADFAVEPPSFRFHTFPGVWGWEPTLGIAPDGTVYYAASENVSLDGGEQGSHEVLVLKSSDGVAWAELRPALAGAVTLQNPGTNDPYLHVDVVTGRVYAMKVRLDCAQLAWTDDAGATWTVNPLGCGHPLEDRPVLQSGPTALPTTDAAFPRALYLCSNQVYASTCKRSLDGGLTFQTGAPPFAGSEDCLPFGSGVMQTNGAVAEADGAFFVARSACGLVQVARTADAGVTWAVSSFPAERPQGCAGESVLAVDAGGAIHAAHLGPGCLPFLASSRDGGASWAAPIPLARPGLAQASHLGIAAGAAGKVAVSYMGTPDAANAGPARAWSWHVAMTVGAFAPQAMWATVDAVGRPLVAGEDAGGGSPGTGLDGIGDFLELAAAPDGRLVATAVDVCHGPCSAPGGDVPLGTAAVLVQAGGATLA